jgi:hypothetical protein
VFRIQVRQFAMAREPLRIRDLPTPVREHPVYRKLIQTHGWTPYILCDSAGAYWSGSKLRDRDGKVFHGISVPARQQIVTMIRSGYFVADLDLEHVFYYHARYDQIYDDLIEFPDQGVIARESLRVLDVRVVNLDAGAMPGQRELHQTVTALGPTTGPQPSSWSGIVERDAGQPSFTYAFQFGDRDLWKIGHAIDVTARLIEVNKHVPHEVLGEQWRLVLQQEWPTEVDAFKMEQRVLKALRSQTSVGERVTCKRQKLKRTWTSLLLPKG